MSFLFVCYEYARLILFKSHLYEKHKNTTTTTKKKYLELVFIEKPLRTKEKDERHQDKRRNTLSVLNLNFVCVLLKFIELKWRVRSETSIKASNFGIDQYW